VRDERVAVLGLGGTDRSETEHPLDRRQPR
jgi:hypothetical protein